MTMANDDTNAGGGSEEVLTLREVLGCDVNDIPVSRELVEGILELGANPRELLRSRFTQVLKDAHSQLRFVRRFP